jgi:hypothetical protein
VSFGASLAPAGRPRQRKRDSSSEPNTKAARPLLARRGRRRSRSLLRGAAAVLGHSTALGGRFVSPINPRVIVMGVGTFLVFARGTQRVELMSRSRDDGRFNFYLIDFEQACNFAP